MPDNPSNPPKWAIRFLEWYCRKDLLEDLQGDLYEYYHRNLNKGVRYANLIFIIDVLKFFRSYTFKKLKKENKMNDIMLFRNYFKTSIRNMARNKLFSSINIIGLAISMSVGLVIITLLSEMYQYDKFHANGDKIYRIVNTITGVGASPMNMATTSVFISTKLEEEYGGFEYKTTIKTRFGGISDTGNKQLAIEGLWASKDFFQVFSFELLEGNSKTALSEPFSIVITETLADKLYTNETALGKVLNLNEEDNYTITGIVRDLPTNSHIKFESLASLSTNELKSKKEESDTWLSSQNMWDTYVYMTIPDQVSHAKIEKALETICLKENENIDPFYITAGLQPLNDIFSGTVLSNQIGPTFPLFVALILGGLALVVILTACFNYTNLSIARALSRTTEIGIRKVVGASRTNIFTQFITESIIIAFVALLASSALFIVIRNEFLVIAQDSQFISLPVDWKTAVCFVLFALIVGGIAGTIPAAVLSKLKVISTLKVSSQVKVYSGLTLRKILVTLQFTLSIIFILVTVISFKQYKHALSYNLGFSAENILNVDLQGVNHDILATAFESIPEVKSISKSDIILHTGAAKITYGKYNNPQDSVTTFFNSIDEHYLDVHKFQLIAGVNFKSHGKDTEEQYVIINEKFLETFDMGTPLSAIGESVIIDEKRLTVVGVVKDFNYASLDAPIEPFAFRYDPKRFHHLNLSVKSDDYQALLEKLEASWTKIDEVHPFSAQFYNDQIQRTYEIFTVMIKVVGFLALLAISIAGMGLLGMSVYEVETRIKEISIRKVMGATTNRLIYLLSKGFLKLILLASILAAPLTYFVANHIVIPEFAYYAPIGIIELTSGVLLVFLVALTMIGFQTRNAAQTNPANTLRNE